MNNMAWTSACLCLLLAGCDGGAGPGTYPVAVKGGMPENEFVDHTFEGSGLKGFDGLEVHVRVGGPEPSAFPRERTAACSATIEGGRFRLFLPQVREVHLYKPYVLFVDLTGEGLCTPGRDVGFWGATSGTRFAYVQEVAGEDFLPMKPEDCGFFSAPWMD